MGCCIIAGRYWTLFVGFAFSLTPGEGRFISGSVAGLIRHGDASGAESTCAGITFDMNVER